MTAGVRGRTWWSLAAIVLAWAAVAATGRVPPQVLPGPVEFLRAALDLAGAGTLAPALAVSLTRLVAGVGVVVLLGLATGVVAGLSRLGHDLVDRPVQALRAVPFTALAPLLLVWFGLGETPKVLLVVVACAVPVHVATVAGVQGTDPRLREVAAVHGLRRWATVRRVVLPGALPSVLAGVRLGLGSGWVAVIVAEQVATDRGVGALLADARLWARTDVVMLCVALYAALGLATDALVRGAEHHLLRWRRPVAPVRTPTPPTTRPTTPPTETP